jgi:hypothetical protein
MRKHVNVERKKVKREMRDKGKRRHPGDHYAPQLQQSLLDSCRQNIPVGIRVHGQASPF